jgi:hypothetical protein
MADRPQKVLMICSGPIVIGQAASLAQMVGHGMEYELPL